MDFQYRAKARGGEIFRGSRSAESEGDLVNWIKDQGWIPIDITKVLAGAAKEAQKTKKSSVDWEDFFSLSPRIKLKDKLVFFKQLSTMLSAGVTISRSLEILVEQTNNKRFKRIISNAFSSVTSGVSLSRSLAEYPRCFDALTLALVNSGEESGTLDVNLVRLATFMEDQESLRKKIITAVTYPAVVVTIALLVLGVMLVVVVPQFQKAFSNMNVKMPKLTLMLFDMGNWARANWILIPTVIFALVMLTIFLRKLESLKYPIDSMMLKIPVFGGVIYKSSVSRSFRTMSSLLESGLPVLKALELAGEVAGNEKVKKGFHMMRDAATMGMPINAIMKEKKLFPPMVTNMVAIGEETGRTDVMLAKVADWYEAELAETIKRLSSTLEPVLVVFVGFIVGIMVMAIFLPIISAIQAFM